MNKYTIYIIICFLITSCSFQSQSSKKNNSLNKTVQLYSNRYDISADSLLAKTFISIPVSNLVFIKQGSNFKSSVEIMIRIEDIESGLQVNRISIKEEIIKDYYEDTRSDDIYQFNYDFLLKKGSYKLIANIKDLDSFNTWDVSENIDIKSKESKLISAYYYKDFKHYVHNSSINSSDSLWVDIPKYNFDQSNYTYSIIQNKDTLRSDKFKNCKLNELLFECPIVMDKGIYGDIEIYIGSNLTDGFKCSLSIHDQSSLWSGDIDIILGVMSYILSYSEIKRLYDLDEKEQRYFISDYLKSKDPDSSTDNNEFLEVIKKRYKYSNDNFSNHSMGWSTDRGEIYIIYGPPESIESLVSQLGNNITNRNNIFNIEKWYYSDKVFIFSNERTFGEMKLVNQF